MVNLLLLRAALKRGAFRPLRYEFEREAHDARLNPVRLSSAMAYLTTATPVTASLHGNRLSIA